MDGTDEGNEGTWVLTTGEFEAPYLNWAADEPTQSTNENCLGSWTNDGTHFDVPCDYRRLTVDVVCEVESKRILAF